MNHVPTVGSVAALGLLFLGYARRNEHLKHVGLEVLFVIALLIVWAASALLAPVQFTEIDPRNSMPIRVQNQLTGSHAFTSNHCLDEIRNENWRPLPMHHDAVTTDS